MTILDCSHLYFFFISFLFHYQVGVLLILLLFEKVGDILNIISRFEDASERKRKILDLIKSLDLPNNPLDDLIDLVTIPLVFCSHGLFSFLF